MIIYKTKKVSQFVITFTNLRYKKYNPLKLENMKTEGLNFLKIVIVVKQFSLIFLAVGGVMYLNEIHYSKWAISSGGLGYSLYCLLSSFLPVHKDPNWELVYPELALGHSDVLIESEDEELSNK